MNKNTVYIAVFGVLCVLAGTLVGAGIAGRTGLLWLYSEKPNFMERAGRFMGHWPKGPGYGGREGGPIIMLTEKLDLTASQKVRVMEILEEMRQKMDKAGENLRSAINEIRETGDKQINDILDPKQKKKFRIFLEEFKKMHKMGEMSGERHMPAHGGNDE